MECAKLLKRIDFLLIVTADKANPNGDPLDGNRPRQYYDGTGYMSAVSVKRKIRNRLQDMGCRILLEQNDRSDDGFTNISERLDSVKGMKDARKSKNTGLVKELALENFADVRSFVATLELKDNTSVRIIEANTIQDAESVGPLEIESYQITKSLNSEPGDIKGSDTMGMRHVVKYGVYVIRGSINPITAEKNGLTEEDITNIKNALSTLFENDDTASRPAGSMNVKKMYWWEQSSDDAYAVNYPVNEVYDTIKVETTSDSGVTESWNDVKITETDLPGLKPDMIVDK